MATLEDLDVGEIIDNMKILLTELLSTKSAFKSSDKADSVENNTKLEKHVQKLEGEVRKHIGIE